jgi:hypothetical protein
VTTIAARYRTAGSGLSRLCPSRFLRFMVLIVLLDDVGAFAACTAALERDGALT